MYNRASHTLCFHPGGTVCQQHGAGPGRLLLSVVAERVLQSCVLRYFTPSVDRRLCRR